MSDRPVLCEPNRSSVSQCQPALTASPPEKKEVPQKPIETPSEKGKTFFANNQDYKKIIGGKEKKSNSESTLGNDIKKSKAITDAPVKAQMYAQMKAEMNAQAQAQVHAQMSAQIGNYLKGQQFPQPSKNEQVLQTIQQMMNGRR